MLAGHTSCGPLASRPQAPGEALQAALSRHPTASFQGKRSDRPLPSATSRGPSLSTAASPRVMSRFLTGAPHELQKHVEAAGRAWDLTGGGEAGGKEGTRWACVLRCCERFQGGWPGEISWPSLPREQRDLHRIRLSTGFPPSAGQMRLTEPAVSRQQRDSSL